MAVDQLQQSSAPRPAETAGKSNDGNDTGSNAEGRRRTLLFAAIIGCVILVGAVSFWWTDISTASRRESMAM
jgi:hypothetical protein